MFAVIFIPGFSLQSVLRLEPELVSRPVALVDPALPKPCIVQLTDAARASGVNEGLTASQAAARCSDLIVKNRSLSGEQTATDVLLQTAYAFSPNIESTAPGVCTIDLKGLGLESTESLPTWAAAIREALAQGGLEGRIGFGPTPSLASLAARAAKPVTLHDAANLCPTWDKDWEDPQLPVGNNSHPHFESFPISALEPPPEILSVLDRWGIETIGSFLALGKDRVVERLGPVAGELFDRVSPESVRPLRLVVPPAEFVEQMEFENEIETAEPLLFVFRRFVEQLSRRLEWIYLVVARLDLRLGLASGAKYERSFKIPAPTGRVETLFRMLQTHLETLRTDSPIVSLRLEANACAPETHQFGLFETTLRDPNQFAETLARLTALCGSDRVGSPVLEATHRPDAFFVGQTFLSAGSGDFPVARRKTGLESPVNPATSGTGKPTLQFSGPPLRRYRPVLSAHVEFRERRPVLFRSAIFNGTISDARGPFFSSGDWWDEKRWAREEWDVQLADGRLCRIFQSAAGWFVEGVYG